MKALDLDHSARTLEEKWGAYITAKNPQKRKLVANAMERQYQYIAEAVNRGNAGALLRTNDRNLWANRRELAENIVPSDIATFTQQSLAMVDMVFEQIVIDQLVHVQTMDGPTAFVHHMAYKQGDSGLYSAGSNFNSGLDPDYADCPAESSSSSCVDGKEVDFALTATTVTSQCKRLRAKYTTQAEQDLQSQYGESLADRLRDFMALELRREMQGEVIDQLIANASTTVTWNSTPAVGSVFESLDPKVYANTLFDAIQTADNGIFKSADGFRGANWIAGDPDGLLRLEKLNSFAITMDGADRDAGVQGGMDSFSNKFGVANHRYDLWKMRFMPADTLLLGVKSGNPQEIGHIHATYVPIADLGTFRDPASACVDIGVMSRYGNSTVRPGLYAVVDIT